jgi:hypothetical protein
MRAFGRALRSPLIGFLLAGLAVPLLVLWAGRVDLGDLVAVGTELVLASLALNGIRFLAQGSRLYVLLLASGIEIDLWRSVIVRGASEFFALTVFPFGADEAFRTVVLRRLGLNTFHSIRVAFAELVFDVMAVAPFAVTAGVMALMAGNAHLATLLVPVASVQLLGSLVMARTVLRGRISGLGHLGWLGELGRRLGMGGAWTAQNADNPDDRQIDLWKPWLVGALASLSLVTALSHAALLQISLGPGGPGLVGSVVAHSSGGVLGSLPVTVGGAGLTEAGIHLSLLGLYGIDRLDAVLRWRIMTYHVCLAISGLMLLFSGGVIRELVAKGSGHRPHLPSHKER